MINLIEKTNDFGRDLQSTATMQA